MMLLGADDPRPWTATNDLVAALPHVQRVVLSPKTVEANLARVYRELAISCGPSSEPDSPQPLRRTTPHHAEGSQRDSRA